MALAHDAQQQSDIPECQGHRDLPSPPCSLAALWWHMITRSRRYQDMVSEMKQLAALATEQELSVEERK